MSLSWFLLIYKNPDPEKFLRICSTGVLFRFWCTRIRFSLLSKHRCGMPRFFLASFQLFTIIQIRKNSCRSAALELSLIQAGWVSVCSFFLAACSGLQRPFLCYSVLSKQLCHATIFSMRAVVVTCKGLHTPCPT